ncbi:MAG: hypothetical protein R3D88_03055 [Alphaproteobacteria bacterium]|nr:hypothetical protein [Alphaproteobacteria bacterium]
MVNIKKIGGLLFWGCAGMTQISPEDAKTNVAAWLDYFGLSDFPSFLNHTYVDTILLLLFLTIGALILFWDKFIDLFKNHNVSNSQSKDKPITKISYLDLVKIAHDDGWDMMIDGAMEAINFKDAVLQGAIDGKIILRGKTGHSRSALLQNIPSDYLLRCNIGTLYIYELKDNSSLEIKGLANDNYPIYLQTAKENEAKFQDLYIEGKDIKNWLNDAKKEYQGRRQKT